MIPENFLDALLAFAERAPRPSPANSADWQLVAPDIRAKSFFSATVEDARLLSRAKQLILDHLSGSKEETSPGVFAYKVGSKADFVRRMREWMLSEGIATEEDFEDDRITNIAGERRLDLVFDTNVRQANGYAYRSQGLQPEILEAFPAAEFVRVDPVREPRPRHAASEGDIRLKTDVAYWAEYQNAAEIGGFEVPWAPYGFNSGMDQIDVDRATSDALGLTTTGQPVTSAATDAQRRQPLTTNLSASARNMDPEIRQSMLDRLRARSAANQSPEALADEAAARARELAMTRTRDAAIARGDDAETERINALLREEEQRRRERNTYAVSSARLTPGGDVEFQREDLN